MEPENDGFQKGLSFSRVWFQVPSETSGIYLIDHHGTLGKDGFQGEEGKSQGSGHEASR